MKWNCNKLAYVPYLEPVLGHDSYRKEPDVVSRTGGGRLREPITSAATRPSSAAQALSASFAGQRKWEANQTRWGAAIFVEEGGAPKTNSRRRVQGDKIHKRKI